MEIINSYCQGRKIISARWCCFISKYKLGTPSKVQRSLQALLSKEMLYTENDSIGNYYCVYDCFLARWLERN